MDNKDGYRMAGKLTNSQTRMGFDCPQRGYHGFSVWFKSRILLFQISILIFFSHYLFIIFH